MDEWTFWMGTSQFSLSSAAYITSRKIRKLQISTTVREGYGSTPAEKCKRRLSTTVREG